MFVYILSYYVKLLLQETERKKNEYIHMKLTYREKEIKVCRYDMNVIW